MIPLKKSRLRMSKRRWVPKGTLGNIFVPPLVIFLSYFLAAGGYLSYII